MPLLDNAVMLRGEVVDVLARLTQVVPPSVLYWYVVIEGDPLAAGAVKKTLTIPHESATDVIVGAPGAICVVTLAESAE